MLDLERVLGPWHDRDDLKIDDLVHAAAEVIPRLADRPDHGRATAIPDARTVRYYIQEGLVDRPHGSAGTAALYGYRHLLQLVAIKVLQGQYVPMDKIREAIGGLENRQLEDQLESWASTPRTMWIESAERWGLRRVEGWARSFASRARRSELLEEAGMDEEERGARSVMARRSFQRLGEPESLDIGALPSSEEGASVQREEAIGSMRERSSDPAEDAAVDEGWSRYELHPGIELHVRQGVTFPESPSFLSALASRLRAILARKGSRK